MKKVPGFDNYGVTKDGQVWSEKSNKFLKPHRLVASLYVDNPEGLKEVNHKDGDKANNCELLGALRVVDVHKRYPQVSRGTISNIKKGYAWCHVSYKFGIVPKRWPEHLSFPIGVDTTNWVRYRKHD
jgi:hypothetical protein